ncbi:dihydroxyacetone phosphate acyltransferase-like isoform X1 [Macrobrachium nipponense]|uniref:dihydroxyacetone phosphate acyltransferase-like isoform X1 n=2 Tax=Macrobrachium nipponense TaxID=159736 RepID=UPI0030C89A18
MAQAAPETSSAISVSSQSVHYMDMLADRRETSDLRWALRNWESKGNYKFAIKMTRTDIFDKVMQSERVKHTIEKMVESGQDRESLEAEVLSILEQMGHTQELAVIRKFAFVLPKIMKKIYGRIFINEDGIEKLRSTIVETPVILLPTHRSYADFLLVSYIAYHFNLPLPVIAAGMDFMNMAVVGEMLRGSGAFYIRRSFMDNPLYWAVFQEYVQNLVEYTGSPMEFFLEGTRSRSGKSLPPKLGLLGCVLECWLRGRLPDLAIVPISISYDRTLEEKLYAYELLGVPKPPESTSGLLKATSILKESFGNICIHVGDPLSVRSFLGPQVERHLSASMPFHLVPLGKSEFNACEALGLHVLRKIQEGAVVSLWSLMCLQFMRVLWKGQWSLPLTKLVEDVKWLVSLLDKIGGKVAIEGIFEEALMKNLDVHNQIACLREDGDVYIQQIHQPGAQVLHSQNKKVNLTSATVEHAVIHLMLQHYINQSIHLLIRPALVAQALVSMVDHNPVCPVEGENSLVSNGVNPEMQERFMSELQARFVFLRSLFGCDFIFEKDREGKDFMEGLALLTWCGEVNVVQGAIHRVERNGKVMSTLLDLIRPFTVAYSCTAQTMTSETLLDNGALVLAIQGNIENVVSKNGVYSALSLDTIRHAVRTLSKIGAVTKTCRSGGQVVLTPNDEKLHNISEALNRISLTPLQSKL